LNTVTETVKIYAPANPSSDYAATVQA